NNAQVVLNVYNVLGQKVVTLLNKEMNAGNYSVNFDAQSLPTGTYFYELKVDEKSKVMKMSLMK
ncbi:MAG: T9SS type A sorting domain-containing protein, partial [Calditrichia bacterium]|nr:T9SS type A sorting domain-containing protein [Calditrichia bacterium]